MPNFAQRVQAAVEALSSKPPKDVDENEFIDASRLVYDGVREIRRAVLMNRVSRDTMRSKTAPEDVSSLSYTWSSRKRERQNTLRVVFSNAALLILNYILYLLLSSIGSHRF